MARKGRHRRHMEARALKGQAAVVEALGEPCPECGAKPSDPHASWCLADEPVDDEE